MAKIINQSFINHKWIGELIQEIWTPLFGVQKEREYEKKCMSWCAGEGKIYMRIKMA